MVSADTNQGSMMGILSVILASACVACAARASASDAPSIDRDGDSSRDSDAQHRIHNAKLDLWLHGAFDTAATAIGDESSIAADLEAQLARAPLRHGPVREVRRRLKRDLGLGDDDNGWASLMHNALGVRGGGGAAKEDHASRLEKRVAELSDKFGQPFADAIAQNEAEHKADCAKSCELFYCADDSNAKRWDPAEHIDTTFASYSFGSVPPEDFSDEFRFPLDLIKVTEGAPLFSAEESARVIRQAEEEGVDKNEYKSGKYKLGGDWLVNLPNTRSWFNSKLEHVLFPLLHHLFPEIIRSPAVLRAHSVSLLKYNHTHSRTDVHIDNGILALTLAMTPQSEYTGGGTFYEHMGADNVLPMDVGHGTFRPGSVRHGGHRVTSGTRYILGAFLLLEDHVEHVRRLKNRGSELRTSGDLQGAINHFEWALALNPRCTTCLKDWAEILLSQKEFAQAEEKIRSALDMLEGLDSDALFTLGLILSEQGKDDESIATYQKSIELNAEDAELCYNLGIKLGGRGDKKGELAMYKKTVEIDPSFGGAWINMGTTLAEAGKFEDAELMFVKAVECEETKSKAMINLALTLQAKANNLAAGGDLSGAKAAIDDAAKLVDDAKPLIDAKVALGGANSEEATFQKQLRPLRVQIHRLAGQILAGMGDMAACEAEFRTASEKYPDVPGLIEALARVLDLQGKADEAKAAREKLRGLV
ncbi:hypothetical protein ACHAXT_007519 [Thalassiosira profunda]